MSTYLERACLMFTFLTEDVVSGKELEILFTANIRAVAAQ
jgi:hypothetical protein